MAGGRPLHDGHSADTPTALQQRFRGEQDRHGAKRLQARWRLRTGAGMRVTAQALGVSARSRQLWGAWYRAGGLAAGHYLFLCSVPGRDGVPHVAKGMVRPIEVTNNPSAPALATSVDWPPAQTTVQVVNNGPQVHEMSVVRLKGISGDQLRQIFSAPPGAPPPGPPPFEEIGGINALAPGETGQTTLNLTPDTYALVCHVPDPATGRPHVSLGMLQTFTVQ